MKLKALIKKLEKLEENVGNKEVVIDLEPGVGWYDIENVKLETYENDEGKREVFINIVSNNEM